MPKFLLREKGTFLVAIVNKNFSIGYRCKKGSSKSIPVNENKLISTGEIVDPSSLINYGSEMLRLSFDEECPMDRINKYYAAAVRKAKLLGADYIHLEKPEESKRNDYGGTTELFGVLNLYLKN